MKMEMKVHPDLAAAPEIESIEIIELLGKGGMSLVYKARQKSLDRIVAVKVLSKKAVGGEAGIKRFQKEAKLTSALDHPNIVKIISFGVSTDGQPYLVMEYLEGLSLAHELSLHGRLKLQKFKDVFLPVLSALGQAHQAGLVHRDIKPGNIMICRSDSGAETVKLVDFGIAKISNEGALETEKLTKSGALMGSPGYMSPEQCLGKPLDGRSDLYSMACVMYEALSGELPFSGASLLEVMQKHSTEPPPTESDLSLKIDISQELARVVLGGLAKDPAARPQTASEFARQLNEALANTTLDRVPLLKDKTEKSPEHLKLLALSVLIVVCVSVLSYYLIYTLSGRRNHDATMAWNRINLKEVTGKETNKRALLSNMASEFDPQNCEFKGSDPRKRLEELNLLILSNQLSSRESLLYVANYLKHQIQKKITNQSQIQLSTLEQCLRLSRKAGEETLESAQVHNDLGHLYYDARNFAKADDEYNHCLHLLKNSNTPELGNPDSLKVTKNHTSVTNCALDLGNSAEAQKRSADAMAYYDLALNSSVYPLSKLVPMKAKLVLLRNLHHNDEADRCLDAFIESLKVYIESGSNDWTGEPVPESKSAFRVMGELGDWAKTSGFSKYALKLYSAQRDYARRIKWSSMQKEAEQNLEKMNQAGSK